MDERFGFVKELDPTAYRMIQGIESLIKLKHCITIVAIQMYIERLSKVICKKENISYKKNTNIAGILDIKDFEQFAKKELIKPDKLRHINSMGNATKHKGEYIYDENTIEEAMKIIFKYSVAAYNYYYDATLSDRWNNKYISNLYAKSNSEELESLKLKVANLEEQYALEKKEHTTKKRLYTRLKNQTDPLKDEIEQMKEKFDNFKEKKTTEVKSLKSKVEELESSKSAIDVYIYEALKEKYKKSQEELTNKDIEYKMQEDLYNTKKAECSNLIRANTLQQDQIKSLKSEISQLSNEISNLKCTAIWDKNRLKELNTECASNNRLMLEKESLIKKLCNDYNSKLDECDKLDKQLQSLKAKRGQSKPKLLAEITQMKLKISQLSGKISELNASSSLDKNTIEELTTQCESKDQMIQNQESQMVRMHNKYNSKLSECESLKEEIIRLKSKGNESSKLKTIYKKLEEEIATNQHLRERIKLLEEGNVSLKNRIIVKIKSPIISLLSRDLFKTKLQKATIYTLSFIGTYLCIESIISIIETWA